MRKDGKVRVLVANLTEFEQEIALEGLGLVDTTVAVLDETTYEAASVDPDFVTASATPVAVEGARVIAGVEAVCGRVCGWGERQRMMARSGRMSHRLILRANQLKRSDVDA